MLQDFMIVIGKYKQMVGDKHDVSGPPHFRVFPYKTNPKITIEKFVPKLENQHLHLIFDVKLIVCNFHIFCSY